MRNFLFISPNYPENYWMFCRELKNNGVRVLGIGDTPWYDVPDRLRDSLTEYCGIASLENYEVLYKTTAYLISKYGRLDWIESNNEYWLDRDALLRTDFHVTSGPQAGDLPRIRYKSGMKEFYRRAGIPAARSHLVDDFDGCADFIRKTGFPVIVKPDNGIGASHTYKLNDTAELEQFLSRRDKSVPYLMEEYVNGVIHSYDAIIDSNGNPLFETGNVTPDSIMELVNTGGNVFFYIVKELAEDVRAAGRAAVKSFGVRSRFVHFEFFRLTGDQPLGRDGDIAALEVNMRPCGGFGPEMMNYANGTNVYKIWADMIAFNRTEEAQVEHGYCAYVGRRDGQSFALSGEELCGKYADNLRMVTRNVGAIADAMGDSVYLAFFPTEKELSAFRDDALRPAGETSSL